MVIVFRAIEKESSLLVGKEKREIETLQAIITLMAKELREKDKHIEAFNQSFKGI